MALTCVNAGVDPAQGFGMGIGRLGDPDIIHLRKFRFTFQVSFCNGAQNVPAMFVRTAGRPGITIEDTEINFLNEKTWVPGKATWEPITVTYYDIATADNIPLLSWIASVYDFTNDTCRWMNARRGDYTGTGLLQMLDGCGYVLQSWTYNDIWPTSIKFGELDMGSSDVCEIELSLRYSKVSFNSNCGGQVMRCGCNPCSTTAGGTTGTGSIEGGNSGLA